MSSVRRHGFSPVLVLPPMHEMSSSRTPWIPFGLRADQSSKRRTASFVPGATLRPGIASQPIKSCPGMANKRNFEAALAEDSDGVTLLDEFAGCELASSEATPSRRDHQTLANLQGFAERSVVSRASSSIRGASERELTKGQTRDGQLCSKNRRCAGPGRMPQGLRLRRRYSIRSDAGPSDTKLPTSLSHS